VNYDELTIILFALDVPEDRIRGFGEGTQVQIPCPLAPWLHEKKTDNNPSLSIKYNVPGKWTVFKCWSCKEYGKLSDLVDSYGRLKHDEKILDMAARLSETDKPSLSERFGALEKSLEEGPVRGSPPHVPRLHPEALERFKPAYSCPRSRKYLEGRSVNYDSSERFGLLYDGGNDRVIFPVKTHGGDLVGAVGRAIENESHPRYFNYFGFTAGATLGGVQFVGDSRPYICVVEGYFDVLNSWGTCLGLRLASCICDEEPLGSSSCTRRGVSCSSVSCPTCPQTRVCQ